MRFNGLKSHLRLQKLRFLDAPGLFLLEIVLTGAYDLADVLANVLVLKWMIGALMGRDLVRAAWAGRISGVPAVGELFVALVL